MKKILHLSQSPEAIPLLQQILGDRALVLSLADDLTTPAFLIIIRHRQASLQVALIDRRSRAKSKFNGESTEGTGKSNRTTNIDGIQGSPLTSQPKTAPRHVTPSACVARHVQPRRETIPSFPFTNRSLGTHPVTGDWRCNS